ncbi:MAG: GAF domain-containing protein [Bacteroidetes bacterium]|nr:GAF domain-containing protein [Bacteroidota bacterium]
MAQVLPETTDLNGFDDLFPFRRFASLEKLIQFWRDRAASNSKANAAIAKEVLAHLEDAPELTGAEVSLEDLRRHPELLELMMTAVFPPARQDNIIASAFVPFALHSFYSTRPFDELKILEKFLHHMNIQGAKVGVEEIMRLKAMSAYRQIASAIYDFKVEQPLDLVIDLVDEETGLNEYYKIIIDPEFVSIITPSSIPELSEKDRRRLLADPLNLELWMDILPPEYFEFHGFVVMTAVDVTQQEVLSRLKNALLLKDSLSGEENLNRLQSHIRDLLSRPNLHLGIIALDRCRCGSVGGARAMGRSLLLQSDLPQCENWHESYYAEIIQSGGQIHVEDLEKGTKDTAFEQRLRKLGFRNIYLSALIKKDEVVGVLELASTNCCDIGPMQSLQLKEITSLLSTAVNRSLEEQEDRVQAIIKKQYTAIHPVVEWKFREAALSRLLSENSAEQGKVEGIVFKNVHPLYGMSDIRGSSELRSTAIKDDLTEQLGLALAVIVEASVSKPRPSLDELGYRLSKHIEDLVAGTRAGDEHALILLLQTEVEPLFDRLQAYSPAVADKVDVYRNALDEKLGVIYKKRKAFEDSVSAVNDTISRFLDEREEEAQAMVPHYFEKFKTDGVEYNIYAGAALQESGEFDELDLKNLKLWQLTSMAGVVWEMNKLRPQLEIPLETAHLVLVQSVPLSIRFRIDEKKFDVDGAYNIRYEIVKKRIDKVRIDGTDERLTQPGMIAIVYSQEQEGEEYTRYLDYLQAAGYIEPGVEYLQLEQLQGVYGLKALRVKVAENKPVANLDLKESDDMELVVESSSSQSEEIKSS